MASERDKYIKISNYLSNDLGIEVNIDRNKARGNKGFFSLKGNKYRIDISKVNDDASKLSTLLHEFAHYIHFINDKTLNSLDFVFPNMTEIEQEELLSITVQNVPKDFAVSLYNTKQDLIQVNKNLVHIIKSIYPEFKLSNMSKQIDKDIKFPYKYLLKYDRVRILNAVYSVDNLEDYKHNLTPLQIAYIKLKSNQRKIRKINSKINRLNKYYNQPSELWARFFESFCINEPETMHLAPHLSSEFMKIITSNKYSEISEVYSMSI